MSESNRVRISVPHNVAHGLQEISGIASSCLAAMRCPSCTSGRSPEFVTLQDAVGATQAPTVAQYAD